VRAESYLIRALWLEGEAALEGVTPTESETGAWLARRRAAFEGGAPEYAGFLRARGASEGDVAFEGRAALAAARLRRRLVASTPRASEAAVAGYYSRHRGLFVVPERREVMVVNRKSEPKATRLRRALLAGEPFERVGEMWVLWRTHDASVGGFREQRERRRFEDAIFAARPDVVSGTVKKANDYYLFEVRRITPGRQRSLWEVRRVIETRLARERQARALETFVGAWRRRWTAKTTCAVGFITAGCNGHETAGAGDEDLLSLS
jgi:hypothetical protein